MIRDDSVGIPLCFTCHSIFHKRGERVYWEEINIDPKVYADELWEEYNETRKL
jgi:predicted HNH restriction endonuclease